MVTVAVVTRPNIVLVVKSEPMATNRNMNVFIVVRGYQVRPFLGGVAFLEDGLGFDFEEFEFKERIILR